MDQLIHFTSCSFCLGQGKRKQKISKKAKLAYDLALKNFVLNKTNQKPVKPKPVEIKCTKCNGTGILRSEQLAVVNYDQYPKIAIIGAGIGGVALAVACLHRGIPFTLFERDQHFGSRSQGYGLTLQQASKAMKALGIFSLEEGVVSTKHIVHNINGDVIGEWGMRKWVKDTDESSAKKSNIHIARQYLRAAILKQLEHSETIKWNHQLLDFKVNSQGKVDVSFQVDKEIETQTFDLLIGADGIRSTVRKHLFKNNDTPLRYLNCMVILGICALNDLKNIESSLLDGATVFQTANGVERIYVMPFDAKHVMWQLSFPISEIDAKNWHLQGAKKLKEEAVLRTQWHSPVPEIIQATKETFISGYPVYDREILHAKQFEHAGPVTFLGDAAHPMSPFKGQGANQAILDALALARKITQKCKNESLKNLSLRESILKEFEEEMMTRSAIKVKDSANAAIFLHTEDVLIPSDTTRGSLIKK